MVLCSSFHSVCTGSTYIDLISCCGIHFSSATVIIYVRSTRHYRLVFYTCLFLHNSLVASFSVSNFRTSSLKNMYSHIDTISSGWLRAFMAASAILTDHFTYLCSTTSLSFMILVIYAILSHFTKTHICFVFYLFVVLLIMVLKKFYKVFVVILELCDNL